MSLGELLSFGIPVPLDFAVTAKAFDYVLDTNYYTMKEEEISLQALIVQDIKKISKELLKEDIKSIEKVDKICANIRYVIEQAKIPYKMRVAFIVDAKKGIKLDLEKTISQLEKSRPILKS